MLSKAMKTKNFGALPSSAGSVVRFAESLKAIGIGYLVSLNDNINRRRNASM
jgi:hypothetical protein